MSMPRLYDTRYSDLRVSTRASTHFMTLSMQYIIHCCSSRCERTSSALKVTSDNSCYFWGEYGKWNCKSAKSNSFAVEISALITAWFHIFICILHTVHFWSYVATCEFFWFFLWHFTRSWFCTLYPVCYMHFYVGVLYYVYILYESICERKKTCGCVLNCLLSLWCLVSGNCKILLCFVSCSQHCHRGLVV